MYIFVNVSEFTEEILIYVPCHILIARLVVPGAESTLMSLSYSILIFGKFFLGGYMGLLINYLFVGVTNDTIDNYYILQAISTICKLIPMTYIYRMLPSQKQIEEV